MYWFLLHVCWHKSILLYEVHIHFGNIYAKNVEWSLWRNNKNCWSKTLSLAIFFFQQNTQMMIDGNSVFLFCNILIKLSLPCFVNMPSTQQCSWSTFKDWYPCSIILFYTIRHDDIWWKTANSCLYWLQKLNKNTMHGSSHQQKHNAWFFSSISMHGSSPWTSCNNAGL